MASYNNGLQVPLPILNGKNYYHWSVKMKVLLQSQDLWSIIQEGYEESDSSTKRNRSKEVKDKKALFLICQTVENVIFERILMVKSSKEAWETLHKTYKGDDKVKNVKLQTLRCEFDNLRMKETETVEDYYNRVVLVTNQLRLNGEIIDDRKTIEKILRSLTRKFECVVVAIEESKDMATFSLENLIGTLQSHELRMGQYEEPSVENNFQLLSSTQIGFKEKKENGSTQRFKTRKKPPSQYKCYKCRRYGHICKTCDVKPEDYLPKEANKKI